MRQCLVFYLTVLLALTGCNFSAGVDVLPTATQALIESTAISTSPALPTETLAPEPSVTPTPEPTFTPAAETPAEAWIAYVGADVNLWLVNLADGEKHQLTQDWAPLSG